MREDLRDLSKVEDLAAVELFAELLKNRAGGLLNQQNLANLNKPSQKKGIAESKLLEIISAHDFCGSLV